MTDQGRAGECGSCKWWGAPYETYTDEDEMRPCWLISGDPRIQGKDESHDDERTKKVALVPWAGADDAMLLTDADFGCVLWETKP